MVIFCKDSRFLADNGKKTALSHKNPRFLAALRKPEKVVWRICLTPIRRRETDVPLAFE